jgi:hypothetical protein
LEANGPGGVPDNSQPALRAPDTGREVAERERSADDREVACRVCRLADRELDEGWDLERHSAHRRLAPNRKATARMTTPARTPVTIVSAMAAVLDVFPQLGVVHMMPAQTKRNS